MLRNSFWVCHRKVFFTGLPKNYFVDTSYPSYVFSHIAIPYKSRYNPVPSAIPVANRSAFATFLSAGGYVWLISAVRHKIIQIAIQSGRLLGTGWYFITTIIVVITPVTPPLQRQQSGKQNSPIWGARSVILLHNGFFPQRSRRRSFFVNFLATLFFLQIISNSINVQNSYTGSQLQQ